MEVHLRRLGPNSKIKILKVPKECSLKVWLAGRGTNCQIYTKSKYASRQHFSIAYREQQYFISDLGSANGTFLNDEKLVEEKMLTFGNIISVGVPSEMQDSPDCIVYVFELHSPVLPGENCSSLPKKDVPLEIEKSSGPEISLDQNNIKSTVIEAQPMPTNKKSGREFLEVDINCDNIEKSDMNDSSSSDVVLIESFNEPKEPSTLFTNESKPAKIRKVENSESVLGVKCEENLADVELNEQEVKTETKVKEINSDDEDIFAYEALTQVDEPEVKTEPELLNYSLSEELIEISDSEDDWCAGVKSEGSKSPDEDEDDDVIILEAIYKTRELAKNDLPPVYCKLEDELTEVDKKWLGRLLKIKTEDDFFLANEETKERLELGDEQEETAMEVDEREETLIMEVDEREVKDSADSSVKADERKAEESIDSSVKADERKAEESIDSSVKADERKAEESTDSSVKAKDPNIIPCVVRLNRLSANDIPDQITHPEAEIVPRIEVPHKIIKKVVPKKSVSFDMVPQIRYFEMPSRWRLTASEKGKLRFARIIFNICNWNTHWLEECKKVAPDKYPPDICEERLRKIPIKFPCHSDYMVAFIPAMLYYLWNKIKDKWINSGHSGFRQTVSCESTEDYHTENLSMYKCTGLAQSVEAHKFLIREGHLVLLRLHQIQNPRFTTPAAEKYSKKLGYLVFGFVESKRYERYHNQPLHQGLAERCASIVGDLHVVRLSILVKKRPSFQIDKRKLIQLTVVQQISPEIRMFKGICLLPDSPLCSAILKPSKIECPLTEPEKKENLIFKGPIDDVQSEIIRKLSHAFFSKNSLLYSIHGAAGSGKGQVIVGLILQLLCSNEWKHKRPKIILCTQWSIPLDEMIVRLKNFRQSVEKPFNLVRVGSIREVKPEVRDLCVSNLASALRNSDKRALNGRKFDAEIEVIKEADVVCMTCISAGTSKVCAAFEKLALRDRDQKIICIIDEAMSCKETDSVVPLLLRVTHLLLVGDVYQLEPTFSGEKTHSVGLDMSLFWRIYKNFLNVPKDLWPIYILKTQYRMNSNLSKFTSQLIYNTPLQKPVVDIVKPIKNIRSHLLLVSRIPENIKEEKENQEVRIVSQLMKAVTKQAKAASARNVFFRFAVITCDTKQSESLQSLLPKREFPEIEIDQIQAFQGREFDVVTFVYDGRKIVTSWLATALTRARCSLFIFASEESINGNSFFRKIASNAGKNNFLKYVHPDLTMKDFEQIITV